MSKRRNSLVGNIVADNKKEVEQNRTERIYPLITKEMKKALEERAEELSVSKNEVYNRAFEYWINS